jgi:hypothetical protein
MVEGHRDAGERSARRRLDFMFDINMAGPPRRHDEEGASPRDRPQKFLCKYFNMNSKKYIVH